MKKYTLYTNYTFTHSNIGTQNIRGITSILNLIFACLTIAACWRSARNSDWHDWSYFKHIMSKYFRLNKIRKTFYFSCHWSDFFLIYPTSEFEVCFINMQIVCKRTTLIYMYFNSLVKEIMTWNWKSTADFFPYSEFNQYKSFNDLGESKKGALPFCQNIECLVLYTIRDYNQWLS